MSDRYDTPHPNYLPCSRTPCWARSSHASSAFVGNCCNSPDNVKKLTGRTFLPSRGDVNLLDTTKLASEYSCFLALPVPMPSRPDRWVGIPSWEAFAGQFSSFPLPRLLRYLVILSFSQTRTVLLSSGFSPDAPVSLLLSLMFHPRSGDHRQAAQAQTSAGRVCCFLQLWTTRG